MKLRYFVAIKVVSETVEELKKFYRDNFSTELSVKNVHLTLVAPFFLKESSDEDELVKKVKEIKVYPFTAKLTGLDFFEQKGRKILYTKAEPENNFLELAERVKIALKSSVEMDIGPYTNGIVPIFKAHVTLDYDFGEIIPETFFDILFPVKKISLFKEESGTWKEL